MRIGDIIPKKRYGFWSWLRYELELRLGLVSVLWLVMCTVPNGFSVQEPLPFLYKYNLLCDVLVQSVS